MADPTLTDTQPAAFKDLIERMRACTLCADELPQPPRPIFSLAPHARVLIVGQAPGRLAHERERPWDDPSGERLRSWLDIDRPTFYSGAFAILPAGLCFPGTYPRGGDRPPTRRCAPTWHPEVLAYLPQIQTVLALGEHAHRQTAPERRREALWQRVADWRSCAPELWLLPHPSWRNNADLKARPWFEQEVLPALRRRVAGVLGAA